MKNLNFNSLFGTEIKDSVYFLSKCRDFCSAGDWYNALIACEEGIKQDENNLEFYKRAIICCVNMCDITKAFTFFEKLKKIAQNLDEIIPYQDILDKKLKNYYELTQQNQDYKHCHEIKKNILNHGGSLNKVYINIENPNNRFLVASENIKKGEVVMKVPRKLTISPVTVEQSDLGRFWDNNTKMRLNNYEHALISVFLLNEIHKGEQSDFYSYLKFLPKDYNNFPVFYKEDGNELKILEDTKFKYLIRTYVESWKEDYKVLKEIIPLMEKISLPEFFYVKAVVSSRLFSFQDNNGKNSCILVPFCDLPNHKKYPNIIWDYDNEKNMFCMITTKDIESGEEIFTKYGNKGNENLLLHYGFTLENNIDNSYIFLLKICNGKKSEMYTKLKIKKDLCDNETKKLFAYLRYMVTDEFIDMISKDQLPDEVISDERLKSFYNPISGQAELKMLKFLGIVVDHYIEDYKDTLANDVKYFNENKNNLNTNELNCWRVRIQEKEILKFYKDFSDFCFELFTSRNNEQMMVSLTNDERFDIFKPYIVDILNNIK